MGRLRGHFGLEISGQAQQKTPHRHQADLCGVDLELVTQRPTTLDN
jgi:hypothetical protein